METANDKNTISVGTKESLSELPPPPRETINHPPPPPCIPCRSIVTGNWRSTVFHQIRIKIVALGTVLY